MLKKDLSIIVPVYNVELYLEECLESLVVQEIEKYEIIIVNDGSTDNSLDICKKYSEKYDFITLISQKNKGLGAARNEGIKHARGKYIGFVDSDDFVDKNMFRKMLNVAMEDDLDLIVCAVKMYFEDSKSFKVIENNMSEKTIITKVRLINSIINGKIQCFAWNKIYKKELFNDIKYDEGVYYEDIYTMYNIAMRCNKSKIINNPLYVYRQRRNNITSQVTIKHINDFNLAIAKVINRFRNGQFYDKNLMMAFTIVSLNTSLDLYIKHKRFNNKDIYKDYVKVYGQFSKYRTIEILFNKNIPFKCKRNYILFVMKILPILKRISINIKAIRSGVFG